MARVLTIIFVCLSLVAFAGDNEDYFEKNLALANTGNESAQYEVMQMYYNGIGTSKDFQKAMEWGLKLAERGNANAQVIVGMMHFLGQGVPQNFSKAKDWYMKAAESGDNIAALNLALLYYNGQGVPKNFKESSKWFLIGAERGNVKAQYSIGYANLYGEGIPINKEEALKWFRKAKENGHKDAAIKIAEIESNRHESTDISTNDSQAFSFFPELEAVLLNNGKGLDALNSKYSQKKVKFEANVVGIEDSSLSMKVVVGVKNHLNLPLVAYFFLSGEPGLPMANLLKKFEGQTRLLKGTPVVVAGKISDFSIERDGKLTVMAINLVEVSSCK